MRLKPLVAAAGATALVLTAVASVSSAAQPTGGDIYSWGANLGGQLGTGETNDKSTVPVALKLGAAPQGTKWTVFDTGQQYTCALDPQGTAYCWGGNAQGQLGNGTKDNSNLPVAVDTSGVLAGKTLVDISAGGAQTCALDSDGKAYCWGFNLFGGLGDGTENESTVPVAVDTSGVLSGKTLTKIVAGFYYACAMDSNGAAYCWGYGSNGQLGDGEKKNSKLPVAVDTSGALSGKTLATLTAGLFQTCGLTTDGEAYCWGGNGSGQLGNGTKSDGLVPTAVDTSGVIDGKPLKNINLGSTHACGIDTGGKAYCWGDNGTGMLGNASQTESPSPVAVDTSGVLAGKEMVQMAAGSGFSCGLDSEGLAYCWGDDSSGQLGDDGSGYSTVPVAVSTAGALADSRLSAISALGSFAAALATTSYQLSYDANGGAGTTPDPAALAAGAAVTTSDGAWASRSGYSLTGWNTAADGGGTGVGLGASFTMPAENTTLFAQWRANPAPTPTPTPSPSPTPVKKKAQKPANSKGIPPKRIKKRGVTVIQGKNALTNAGQRIRARVFGRPMAASAAGETRYLTVIRGPKGKVSVRTYGKRLRIVVRQSAPATDEYRRYARTTLYVNGKRR